MRNKAFKKGKYSIRFRYLLSMQAFCWGRKWGNIYQRHRLFLRYVVLTDYFVNQREKKNEERISYSYKKEKTNWLLCNFSSFLFFSVIDKYSEANHLMYYLCILPLYYVTIAKEYLLCILFSCFPGPQPKVLKFCLLYILERLGYYNSLTNMSLISHLCNGSFCSI